MYIQVFLKYKCFKNQILKDDMFIYSTTFWHIE